MRGVTKRRGNRSRSTKNPKLNAINVIRTVDAAMEKRGRGPEFGTERQTLGVQAKEREKGMVNDEGKTYNRAMESLTKGRRR